MPKKKKENEVKPDEQWERFKEAAAKADVDDKQAEKTFSRLSRAGNSSQGAPAEPEQKPQ